MGQYYRALLEKKAGEGENKFIDKRAKNIECHGYKLTEHAYIGNETMNYVGHLLNDTPHKIWWVGDYALQMNSLVNNMTVGDYISAYNLTWDSISALELEEDYDKKLPNNGLLVNWTKQEYIHLGKYDKDNTNEYLGHAIHPLALLTCISNGLGGGDYWGINNDLVGSWAGDLISIEGAVTKDFKDCTSKYIFIEE